MKPKKLTRKRINRISYRGGCTLPILRIGVIIMVKKNVKPNTVCRNENCRKHFFACKTCVGQNQWRAVACSFECYNEYMKQVEKSRSLGETVSLLPESLDMSEREIVEFQKKDPDEIKDEAICLCQDKNVANLKIFL